MTLRQPSAILKAVWPAPVATSRRTPPSGRSTSKARVSELLRAWGVLVM